jgi:hypothetical protein
VTEPHPHRREKHVRGETKQQRCESQSKLEEEGGGTLIQKVAMRQ